MTQADVGEKFGVDRGTVSGWENDEHKPVGERRKAVERWIWSELAPQEGVAEPRAPYGGIEVVIAVRVVDDGTRMTLYGSMVGSGARLIPLGVGGEPVLSTECQIIGVYRWLIRERRDGRLPGAG